MVGTAIIAAFVGMVLCFFGYRMFTGGKPVMGFLIGGAIVVTVLSLFVPFKDPIYLQPLAIGAFLAGGILGALLANPLYLGFVFTASAYFGWFLVFSAVPLITRIPGNTLVAVIVALVFGLLSIMFQEIVLTVATAFIGAAAITYAAQEVFKLTDIPLMIVFFSAFLFGAAAQYKSEHP